MWWQVEGAAPSSSGEPGAEGAGAGGAEEAEAAVGGTLLFASFRRGSGGRLLRLQQLAGMEVPQVASGFTLCGWRALLRCHCWVGQDNSRPQVGVSLVRQRGRLVRALPTWTRRSPWSAAVCRSRCSP